MKSVPKVIYVLRKKKKSNDFKNFKNYDLRFNKIYYL